MLNRLDDYPIHQTPEPLAHPASTDRNVYDRTWFNGYTADGSYYFGVGMALYPHRGVLDCAFSVIEQGGRQHCFYGSRRAPLERTDLTCGPFRLEIEEPLRRVRLVLDDNPSGLAADLTFSARTSPIEEHRQRLGSASRITYDVTRFDQFGRWSGTIRHPDGELAVSDAGLDGTGLDGTGLDGTGLDGTGLDGTVCHGTKDRSWGIRRVGEPETGGAPVMPGGIFFLWAPLIWSDHVTHAIFFDGPRGEMLVREGIVAPLHGAEADIPDALTGTDERMATARHRVRYHPGTRLAAGAEIDLVPLDGPLRTIGLEPLLRFQMKGLGYLHPTWGHGIWHGELEVGGESFDPAELDPLAPENIHVQQVVRATDDSGRVGTGVLEQVVIGPYAPAGFSSWFDGAADGAGGGGAGGGGAGS